MSLAAFISDTVGRLVPRVGSAGTRDSAEIDVTAAPPDTRRMIRNRQYGHVLAKDAAVPFDDMSVHCARSALEFEMSLVPGGEVCLVHDIAITSQHGFEMVSRAGQPVSVEPFYIDRDCVTNDDYAKFVKAGGYSRPEFWPEGVLADVLHFVDSSGTAGPKFWHGGKPPRELLDHPVVGICWYEANAYATWAGKRLPSSEEWQRAGTWPKASGGTNVELRYPWGNAFDPFKANTWACGVGRTFPVDGFGDGNTPGGVRQLIGNVWEWVDAQFMPLAQEGVSVRFDDTLAEIRGGAFDTYFHSQATCQFRTGQPLLHRGHNVGFRCCISESAIVGPPQNDDCSHGNDADPFDLSLFAGDDGNDPSMTRNSETGPTA